MSDSGSDFAADLVAADGTRHPLAGEMRIGRSNDCEITIENDAKVSRKHAVFRVEGDSVTVEDLGSANGTLVNGQRIAGVTALAHGDALEFEKHRYTLEIAGQELAEDDATIVNPPEDDDVTVVNAPEPPPPPPPPPVATDLPGAWVDDPGMGEHTQVMDFGGAPMEHLYTNQTAPYYRAPHIYLATAARFMPGRKAITDKQADEIGVNKKYFNDCSDAVLLSSRGGKNFTFLSQ